MYCIKYKDYWLRKHLYRVPLKYGHIRILINSIFLPPQVKHDFFAGRKNGLLFLGYAKGGVINENHRYNTHD